MATHTMITYLYFFINTDVICFEQYTYKRTPKIIYTETTPPSETTINGVQLNVNNRLFIHSYIPHILFFAFIGKHYCISDNHYKTPNYKRELIELKMPSSSIGHHLNRRN